MKKFLALYEKWSTEGLRVPFLHDSTTGRPSVTLLFPYVSFIVLLLSIVYLHINPSVAVFGATTITFFLWVTATTFYKLRKLDKMKFNLESKSLELTGSSEDK